MLTSIHRLFIAPLIVVLLFLVFFQEALGGVVAKVFLYSDEALLGLALVSILIPVEKDTRLVKAVILTLCCILFFIVISYNAFSFQAPIKIIMQAFIHCKTFIFFLILYTYRKYLPLQAIVHALFIITLIGVVLNLIMGPLFINALNAHLQYRFGFVRPVGFQADTFYLGLSCCYFYLYYLFKNKDFDKPTIFIPLTIGFTILFVISSLRTPFAALAMAMFFIFIKSIRGVIVGAVIMAVLGGAVLLTQGIDEIVQLTQDDLEGITDPDSQYMRGMMIYFSVVLALENFPLGTGAATYGTILSKGGPIYDYLGLSTFYAVIQEEGIYDSNFASVFGEFGFLGLAAFLFIGYKLVQLVWVKGGNHTFLLCYSGFVLFYFLVAPVFTSGFGAMMTALILAAMCKHIEANKEAEQVSSANSPDKVVSNNA